MSFGSDSPSPSPPPAEPSPAPTDAGGEVGGLDASTTLGKLADELILTESGSLAGQLLSTSAAGALSDPYSSAQGGWIDGAPDVDPYTNVVAGDGIPNPYVGRDVDTYTNLPSGGANPNAFTGGQDVDVYSGRTGGGLLGSLDLLASNGPIQSSGPQLTADQVGALLVGSTPVGEVIISGTTYSQSLVNIDGVPTYLYYNDRTSIWWTEPAPATATQATPAPPAPPASSPAAAIVTSAPVAPTSGPAQGLGGVGANSVPVAPAGAPMTVMNPPVDWTTQTEWAYPAPDRRLIQPVTHYDSGNRGLNFVLNKVVLPWRNALAFAENVPLAMLVGIDDALRHSPFEAEYRAAQDMMPLEGAMGLTMEIGPAVDYAATWLSTSSELRSLVTAPVFWFMGAGGSGGGFVSAPLGVPAVVDAAADLPALAPELATSLPAGGTNSGLGYGSLAEEAATIFQDRVRQAESMLRANPDLVSQLGGSHTGAPVSIGQLSEAARQYEEGKPQFARALGGNAMEALVDALNQAAPASVGSFRQVGGAYRIDFIGIGAYEGFTFELTTEAGVLPHSVREYVQRPGAMIFTYTLPF